MAVAASLNVLLTANAAQFTTTMGRAEKTVAGFSNAVSIAKSSIAALGAGFGFSALGRSVLHVVDAFERADSAGKRLGIAYNSLVTLQSAAEENASSIEVMNGSLQRMTKLLGDASFGESGAVKTLDRLGLSYATLRNLAPENQFALIMERVQGLANEEQRATAIQDVFGRGAAELGNLLGMSSSEMSRFRNELQQSGKLLSGEQLEDLRKAATAVDELSRAWSGFATSFVSRIAPLVVSGLKIMEGVLNPGRAVQNSLDALAVSRANGSLEQFGPNYNGAWQEMMTTSGIRRTYAETLRAMFPNSVNMATGIVDALQNELPKKIDAMLGAAEVAKSEKSKSITDGIERRRIIREAQAGGGALLSAGASVGNAFARLFGGKSEIEKARALSGPVAAQGIAANTNADRLFTLNKQVQQASQQPLNKLVKGQDETNGLLGDVIAALKKSIPVIDL